MASEFPEKQTKNSERENTVQQRSSSNRNRLYPWNSFDRISVLLVLAALLLTVVLATKTPYEIFSVAIALMSVVFTLLSVRESKRDREASVAPTLFVGERGDEEYGILNLGNGPAHELSVKTAETQPDDWRKVKPRFEGRILRTDEFLPIPYEEFKWVKMEYRSNVGYKQYDVTREVLVDS